MWLPRGSVRLHFNHLGLPVRDERRSQQFYSAYFGFDPATAQKYADGTIIIRNADGFDLALRPVADIEPPPAFLHAGFKAAVPADVRALLERMEADGITIIERDDEAAYTAFKCLTRTVTGSRCTGSRFSPGDAESDGGPSARHRISAIPARQPTS